METSAITNIEALFYNNEKQYEFFCLLSQNRERSLACKENL